METEASFRWSRESRLAWTTAAVDNERVVGAFPIVMDMLKLQKVSFVRFSKVLFDSISLVLCLESPSSLPSMSTEIILFLRHHAIHSIVIERLDLRLQWLLWCQHYTIRRHSESRPNGWNRRSIQSVNLFVWLLLWLEIRTSRLSWTIQEHENLTSANRWWWILLAWQWGKDHWTGLLHDPLMIVRTLSGMNYKWWQVVHSCGRYFQCSTID